MALTTLKIKVFNKGREILIESSILALVNETIYEIHLDINVMHVMEQLNKSKSIIIHRNIQ
jgi:hypothetical protein